MKAEFSENGDLEVTAETKDDAEKLMQWGRRFQATEGQKSELVIQSTYSNFVDQLQKGYGHEYDQTTNA